MSENFRGRRAIAFALASLVALLAAAYARAGDDVAAELWANERKYQAASAAGDVDTVVSFWHEDGVAWPEWSAKPLERGALREAALRRVKERPPGTRVHELTPISVKLGDGFAVVHYRLDARHTKPDGTVVELHYLAMHTWLGGPGHWRVISGTSRIPPNSAP